MQDNNPKEETLFSGPLQSLPEAALISCSEPGSLALSDFLMWPIWRLQFALANAF